LTAGIAADLREGVDQAMDAISSGAPESCSTDFVEASRG
jgi:anthranilate phosphoribosyltransferase